MRGRFSSRRHRIRSSTSNGRRRWRPPIRRVPRADWREGIRQLGPLVLLELPALELDVQLKRYDAALQRVDVLAAHSPRQEEWLRRRGEILELAGRPAEARAAWAAAWAALETLPPHRRQVPAAEQLAATIQAALQRLDAQPKP